MGKKKEKPKHNLEDIIYNNKSIYDKDLLTNVYLKFIKSERTMSNAYYIADICTYDGVKINDIEIKHKYSSKKQDLIKNVSQCAFYKLSLGNLMSFIQKGKLGNFSSVELWAQEKTIEYKPPKDGDYNTYNFWGNLIRGPPQGWVPDHRPHYYLELILGTPGKKVKLSKKTKPVKACKSCDSMLLRYSYNWIMQKDDLELDKCPYCNQSLVEETNTTGIIERDRKYLSVKLNFKSEDCVIEGTNNQIGIIYNNIPIKTTVKVAALRNFLMNYQNLFPNKVMGPFDIKMNIAKSKKGYNLIESVNLSPMVDQSVEWRPVTLFPEDLIAF